MDSYLFLFEIFNKDIFLNNVKKFLELAPKRSLSNLTVRVHPLNKKSKVHQEVSEKLKNLLKLYSLKFKKKTKKKFNDIWKRYWMCVFGLLKKEIRFFIYQTI